MDVSKLVYASVTNGQKVNKVIFIFQSFLRIEIKWEAQKKYATYTGGKKKAVSSDMLDRNSLEKDVGYVTGPGEALTSQSSL